MSSYGVNVGGDLDRRITNTWLLSESESDTQTQTAVSQSDNLTACLTAEG